MEKKYTFNCKFCNKENITEDKNLLHCNQTCEFNCSEENIKKTSKCIVCQKKFNHYGESITCSKKCLDEYVKDKKIGENNPAFKEVELRRCVKCNKEFEMPKSFLKKDREFCSLACKHEIAKQNPIKTDLKSNKICAICGDNKDVDACQIDESCSINLCEKCKQSKKEEPVFWEIVFSGLVSSSKIVKKEWGAEIHIANNNDYCLKYLIFFKNKQFSHHLHNLKKELWHCIYGNFECVLEKNNEKIHLDFNQGQKIEIEAGVIHQLQAKKNSILVEVSTRDYPEDSIRIFKGENL